jgi:hypothetical protein
MELRTVGANLRLGLRQHFSHDGNSRLHKDTWGILAKER